MENRSGSAGCGTWIAVFVLASLAVNFYYKHFAGQTESVAAKDEDKDAPTLEPDKDLSTYFIDARVRLHHAFYGCPRLDGLDKVKEMQRAHDVKAIEEAAAEGMCQELYAGDRGTVTDHSVWHGSTCMRRDGDPDCLWVPDPVIEKDKPAAAEPATASSGAANSARCKAVITQIVASTGSVVTGFSPSGDNAFLRHSSARDIVLMCSPNIRMAVSVSVASGRPSQAFLSLAAKLGAVVTHQPIAKLAPLIKRCQSKAHRNRDQNDEEDILHAEVDCSSFDHDGGDTLISIAQGKDDFMP